MLTRVQKLQKEGKLPAEEKPSEAVQKSSRVGDTHCTAIDDHAGVLEKAGEENKASVADRVSARLTSVTGK